KQVTATTSKYTTSTTHLRKFKNSLSCLELELLAACPRWHQVVHKKVLYQDASRTKLQIKHSTNNKRQGANLLKALDSLANATANFRQLLRPENEHRHAGNDDELRNPKSEEALAGQPPSLSSPGRGHREPDSGPISYKTELEEEREDNFLAGMEFVLSDVMKVEAETAAIGENICACVVDHLPGFAVCYGQIVSVVLLNPNPNQTRNPDVLSNFNPPNPRSALPPPPPPPPPQPFVVIANTARHPDRITPNASIAKYSTPLSRSIQPVHPKPRGRPARKSLGQGLIYLFIFVVESLQLQTEQTLFTVSPVPGDRKSFADRGRRAPYRMKLWATNEVRAKSKS
ncbi:60S ribosomal protein L18a, partial [Striga asiatica]